MHVPRRLLFAAGSIVAVFFRQCPDQVPGLDHQYWCGTLSGQAKDKAIDECQLKSVAHVSNMHAFVAAIHNMFTAQHRPML